MNIKIKCIENWSELAHKANWSVARLAGQCNVSTRTLERYFNKTMGRSPKVWLNEQRQRQAFELLRDGSTVKETANRTGYQHVSSFSREFKKYWRDYPATQTADRKPAKPSDVA